MLNFVIQDALNFLKIISQFFKNNITNQNKIILISK